MYNLDQLKSQIRQLLFFHNAISLSKLLKDAVSFPFEYLGSSGKASLPWAINLLVTSKCNLHCEMCSFDASKFCSLNGELSLEDIKFFIKGISKRKIHIFLSGGEPFLRKDIFEIIDVIKGSGLTWGICTNGTLLDENKIRKLVKLKPEFIIFSLFGVKENHDKITGVSGSFERLFASIQTLSSLTDRTKVIINCPITKSNIYWLKETIKIAETLKVSMVRFEHLNFLTSQEVGEHNKICEKEFPNEKVFLSTHLENNDIENWQNWHRNIEEINKEIGKFKIPVYFKPFLNNSEIRSWYSSNFSINRKCYFVWRSLFISPNGDILPCQFLIYKLGNIKNISLEEAWNSKKYKEFRLRLKKGLLPGCSRCCKL